MTTPEQFQNMKANVALMNSKQGFDVVIVCCTSKSQAEYWQKRLDRGKGEILPNDCIVLAVDEDWKGGAGNALGTLYAFECGARLAESKHGIDLRAGLSGGQLSVALYHIAGKGTRLSPLPAAENNNKPGAKLPATIALKPAAESESKSESKSESESSSSSESERERVAVTILEAVVRQTAVYAKNRSGRLSVFWGDQVFLPSLPLSTSSTTSSTTAPATSPYLVDILCSLGPMPSEDEWRERGLDKYGLIAVCEKEGENEGEEEAAQVEKVDRATAVRLLRALGRVARVGPSLGCFSLAWPMLRALLAGFAPELSARAGKMDADPHLWMPLTLARADYCALMEAKGESVDKSGAHHDRVRALLAKLREEERAQLKEGERKRPLFGPVDVGQGAYWWDYGQLKLYQKNCLLATQNSDEANLMRSFYGLDSPVLYSSVSNTDVTDSCVSNCILGKPSSTVTGSVRGSMLVNVRCNHIDAEDCVLVNVTADRIVASKGAVVYNVAAEGSLEAKQAEVLSGVFSADGSLEVLRSNIAIDGGKAWETVLSDLGNVHSFEQIHNLNLDSCPTLLEKVISNRHNEVWNKLSS